MSDVPELFPLRPAVLKYDQAATYLGISPGRLRNLMWLGIGPRKISYGKRDVRFRVQDLNEFIESKVQQFPDNKGIKRPRGRPRKVAVPPVYEMDGCDGVLRFDIMYRTIERMEQITFWDIVWYVSPTVSLLIFVGVLLWIIFGH
ncbi:helix-turn-helix transcriptional regulator [Acetobacter sp.]|uniref:helix-turn-helix transcriptional regulator n=1 Tax=Acetobacter sp. TaxID=440 RepID=UPI0039EA7C04